MKTFLMIISLVALAATLVPGILFLAGSIDQETVKWLALLGTIVWFAVTPFWMSTHRQSEEETIVI